VKTFDNAVILLVSAVSEHGDKLAVATPFVLASGRQIIIII